MQYSSNKIQWEFLKTPFVLTRGNFLPLAPIVLGTYVSHILQHIFWLRKLSKSVDRWSVCIMIEIIMNNRLCIPGIDGRRP